jgi:peptidoglycan/LPS O-acetylase OafA/YrhL
VAKRETARRRGTTRRGTGRGGAGRGGTGRGGAGYDAAARPAAKNDTAGHEPANAATPGRDTARQPAPTSVNAAQPGAAPASPATQQPQRPADQPQLDPLAALSAELIPPWEKRERARGTSETGKPPRREASARRTPATTAPERPWQGTSVPGMASATRATGPSGATRATGPGGGRAGGRTRAAGLDGVRALAVLAVMAFHEGIGAAPGGFLGVDVFFVLSGFLITDLLVAQRDRLGRLDLRGFWTRRARRLLPALAVVLVSVTAAVALIEPDQLGPLRPVLIAAASYSSNWYQALHHVSYFASYGPPPPLQHLWSLAIEEQFYLVWPLVLLLVLTRLRGRRGRALVSWLGAAASAAAMALLYTPGTDPSRVYYGTDTHATALLVGTALALTWPLARLSAASQKLAARLDLVGIASLAVLAWALGHLSGADPAVYPAGLAVAALASAGLVAAAAAPGAVGALLSLRPLRWLGVRSYGIYLWHWPVIALTAALVAPHPVSPWLWGVEAALAIAIAAASWRWIEAPILRDGFRASARAAYRVLADSVTAAGRSPARALPVVIAAAAVSVACTAGYGVIHPPATSGGLQQQVSRGERVSQASRAASAGAPTPGSAMRGSGHLAAPKPSPSPAVTQPGRRVRGSQVTAVGDSVMLASAPQLAAELPGIYIDAQVSRQMSAGLGVIQELAASGRLRQVVVVGLGTNGTVTSGQIHELLSLIGPRRSLVLINTYEARPWEHEVNDTLAAAARDHPNIVLADWLSAIQHRTGLLWSDGVHPRPPGARLYARVVAAAVQATRRPPAPVGAHIHGPLPPALRG